MDEARVVVYDEEYYKSPVFERRLHDLRRIDGNSLKYYLDGFFSVVMNLQNIDVKLHDEDLVITLLWS